MLPLGPAGDQSGESPGDIFIQTLVKLLGLIGHESYNSDE